MATSRKRERELARRRFERRRQQEMARRAAAKRRNSIIGAVAATIIVLGGVAGLIVALSGGSKHKASASTAPTTSPSPTVASSSPPPAAPTKCAKISPNPPAKGQPTIPPVTGKVPTKLVVKDVKKGTGRAAQKDDTLEVTYIGVSCDTGKVFDASYLHPPVKPFQVKPLGSASVIQGWNQGLIGIKKGGVRELIIPAALGYGTTGSPPNIPGNDTLIFLVTAKSVVK